MFFLIRKCSQILGTGSWLQNKVSPCLTCPKDSRCLIGHRLVLSIIGKWPSQGLPVSSPSKLRFPSAKADYLLGWLANGSLLSAVKPGASEAFAGLFSHVSLPFFLPLTFKFNLEEWNEPLPAGIFECSFHCSACGLFSESVLP